MTPFSRGNISLASPNGAVLPSLDTDILGHPWDMEMAIAAFRRVRKIWKAMPEVTIGKEYFPGDDVVEDDDIDRYIRATGGLLWHAVGTCAMGERTDPMAVVDTQGLVFGVSNLRVVDASIFPFLPRGPPMSSVYMIAGKIADQILSC